MGNFPPNDVMSLYHRAEEHHAAGRNDEAHKLLVEIGSTAKVLPQGYTELRRLVGYWAGQTA